jgi:hypothetical protein
VLLLPVGLSRYGFRLHEKIFTFDGRPARKPFGKGRMAACFFKMMNVLKRKENRNVYSDRKQPDEGDSCGFGIRGFVLAGGSLFVRQDGNRFLCVSGGR